MKMPKIQFWKKDDKLEKIEDDIDLIEFEINNRLAELADLEPLTDHVEQARQLREHVVELQKVLNEKMKVKAELEREAHKPLITPDTAAKCALTGVSLFGIYLLQRDGLIDHAMEKFIPRPY